MAEKEEKKELSTTQLCKRWKGFHIATKAFTYALPFIPGLIDIAVNWQSWFYSGSGWSIPFGTLTLIFSGVLAALLIYNKDNELMKKVSPIVPSTFIMVLLGVAFIFLGELNQEVGKIFLYTAGGMVGSIVLNQIDTVKIEPRYKEYKELVDKYVLDKKAVEKAQRQAKAKLEREEKAKQDGITLENIKEMRETPKEDVEKKEDGEQ